MNIEKEIRKILLDEDIEIKELASRLNTSQQNISAKLKRNNFTVKDVEKILDALGYEVKIEFIKKMQQNTVDDVYDDGFYNGIEYCLSVLEDREANYRPYRK